MPQGLSDGEASVPSRSAVAEQESVITTLLSGSGLTGPISRNEGADQLRGVLIIGQLLPQGQDQRSRV